MLTDAKFCSSTAAGSALAPMDEAINWALVTLGMNALSAATDAKSIDGWSYMSPAIGDAWAMAMLWSSSAVLAAPEILTRLWLSGKFRQHSLSNRNCDCFIRAQFERDWCVLLLFFVCQTTYDIFRIQIYWMRPVICVCPRECVHLIFPNHSAWFHRNIRIHSKTFHFFYFIRIDHGHCCLRTFECIFQPFICRMLYSIRCTVRDMWIFFVCWFAAFILRSIVLHGMCCGQTPADGSMDWTFIIRSANWRCWYVLGVRLLVQHI